MVSGTKQRIQSLDRGLQILEYVAELGQPVRLSELARLLGVEKSSAHRLARTLAERGYLRQDPQVRGFVLDNKVFALAGKLACRQNFREQARKYLQILAQKTGETAHLAVRGKAQVVLVDHEFGAQPIAVTTTWGHSEPLHCTALGKALLIGLDKNQIREIMGRQLKRYTKNTIARLDDLVKECLSAKEQNVAFDLAEFRQDMNCIASAVYDFRGEVVAAIGISGPSERLRGRAMDRAARVVKQCAGEFSNALGHCRENSSR